MKILGYGEDALTYWALTTQLGQFLGQPELNDESAPEKALVIYRPSFGRGVGFGEFDAIVATQQAVYLIESKWHKSKELTKDKTDEKWVVKIDKKQVDRHRIFQSYWELFNRYRLTLKQEESDLGSWMDFLGDHKHSPDRNAKVAGTLDKNLYFVLNRLHGISDTTKNVLLFLSPVGWERLPTRVMPKEESFELEKSFELVKLQFPVTGGEGYFEMNPPSNTSPTVPPHESNGGPQSST